MEGAAACPGCGATLAFVPRYPRRFCNACLNLAKDAEGRSLAFGNAALSGGLVWRHAGEGDWSGEVRGLRCLIRGRPALVQEARFGGVVAEPDEDAP